MSKAEIQSNDGRLKVSGELIFATVTGVLAESRGLFAQTDETIEVELGEVKRVDSAGLALLIEWMRMASAQDKAIRFINLPEQMMEIAAASDLESILPLA